MVDRTRFVELWLSDFVEDPRGIAAASPMRPFLVTCKGEPAGKRGRPAHRNVVIFRRAFRYEDTWTEAIEELVAALGGWAEIEQLLDRVDDAKRLIQLTLPIGNSPHQENNFIEAATLERLARLKIDLGMEFGPYQVEERPEPPFEGA
ncbi:hypothetical protein [Aliidongia dinghuensis]|nr:hypothetical protein [Aliidongia dinghuensis]